MPATVTVNSMTVVHADSGGLVTLAPDVCKTPSPGGPVPIPYVNIAKSQDTAQGSQSVKCDGNPVMVQGSVFSQSSGDEPGSAGGVASSVTKGKAEFINFSFDVMFDGKPVARLGDMMLGNKGSCVNTPPAPEVQPPAAPAVIVNQQEKRQLEDITVRLVDPQGEPVKDAQVIIKAFDGTKTEQKTDGNGEVRVQQIIGGPCRIYFPDEKYQLDIKE